MNNIGINICFRTILEYHPHDKNIRVILLTHIFGLITASEVMTFHLITLEKLVNLKLDNPKLGTIY